MPALVVPVLDAALSERPGLGRSVPGLSLATLAGCPIARLHERTEVGVRLRRRGRLAKGWTVELGAARGRR